jgi:alkane 1-monooxygenase
VHHVHVSTPNDPNSAQKGRSFYRFFVQAWIGSFREGLRYELKKASSRTPNPTILHTPYAIYALGALTVLTYALWLFGPIGLISLYLLAIFSQALLLLSDYVQHYGLQRGADENGKAVPVDDHHAWNAPHWFTAGMTLNAPRHSEHHTHPDRSYDQLQPVRSDEMPTLPYSMPVMAVIALWPAKWFSVMNPRVENARNGIFGAGKMHEQEAVTS